MDGDDIEVNCGNMQTLLIVHTLLSQCLCQSDDHRTAADTGFLRPDKLPLLHEVLGVMHEHLCHSQTNRVGREELARLFVMDFQAVIQYTEHISGLLFETQDEHAE